MIRLPAATATPTSATSVSRVLGGGWGDVIVVTASVVAAMIILWVARRAARRARRQVEHATGDEIQPARRAAAITFAVVNVVRVGVFVVLVFVLLWALGVNIGPVLAGASFIGAGLAFGAQSIVKDYLAGFYILTENQFSVGDSLEASLTGGSPVTGVVVDLTLRRTAVRVKDGSLVSFGNGSIVSTRNRSRGTGSLRVEVEVPRRGSLEEMSRNLEGLVASMREDVGVAGLATSDLFAVGAEPTASGSVQLIVTAQTLPSHRTELEREIRTRLNRRFLTEPAAAPDPESSSGAPDHRA
jgi:small conductance mechanosensitive channel